MKKQIIERFPGIGCAWMDHEGNVSAEYYGMADIESQTAVDESIIFPACSISKFVTAMCVMKLHERGFIDINMPVNQYLDQWKLLTAAGTESRAAIRAILCHTAGILDGEDAFYGLRRTDPEISLTDILRGITAYNNRPVLEEKPFGTEFEYSDAGYCVLQLLVQEVTQKAFDIAVREFLFDPLALNSTFFATSVNMARYENRMTTGYDDNGQPIPGKFPVVPDLAASGLWSTPKELLVIAHEFVKAFHGGSSLLKAESAQEMARPAKGFTWTGLGVFTGGDDILTSQGWGENGQCMMKINCRTQEISIVMTNQNPGVDQMESGVEWLANSFLSRI